MRKLSGKLPSTPAEVWLPIAALLGLVSIALFFLSMGESPLMRAWFLCMVSGAVLHLLGDFLLNRGRWVVGDLSRIIGFVGINLGIVLSIAWLWEIKNEGLFWYSLIVYGTVLIFAASASFRNSRNSGPRVR